MADLDNFLEGEDWADDVSVEQDKFNKNDFNKVKPKSKTSFDEDEAPVNGRSAGISTAIEEDYNYELEIKEKQQAKQIAAAKPAPMPAPMPKIVVPVAAPKMEKKPSISMAKVEKKPSMSMPKMEKKPSMSMAMSSKKLERQQSQTSTEKAVEKGEKVFEGDRGASKVDKAFATRYSPEVVDFFSKVNQKSLTQQAIEYLNAYWNEVGDQAEFIFSVSIKVFREADMHRQGISLYYKYDEGSDVDYPTYLYFYEKLVKFLHQNPEWTKPEYAKSQAYEVKTAIKHKKDLQEKVDVNFDGRISFLEFLLYQYNVYSNPADYVERAKAQAEEHPAVTEARLALDEVNKRIRAYEEERARLTEGAAQPGVKGLTFKHQLTMLDKSPLSEQLNVALITAEAAVRIAVKKFQDGQGMVTGGGAPRGALWWMQRDLDEKKRVMVPRTLRRVKKEK